VWAVLTFRFRTDDEAQEFCEEIARQISKRFNISIENAVDRINRLWSGQDFFGEDDRYHWLLEFWVKHIYAFYEEHGPKQTE
jgi:hypothetical protein